MIGWQTIYSKSFSLSNISTSVRSSATYTSIDLGSPDIRALINDYEAARIRLHIDHMEYSAYGTTDYSDRSVFFQFGTSANAAPWYITLDTPNITSTSHNIYSDVDMSVINYYLSYAVKGTKSWRANGSSATFNNTLRMGYRYFTLYSLTGTFYIEGK